MLYRNALLLSWLAPTSSSERAPLGRAVVQLDLANCLTVESALSLSHPRARDDVGAAAARDQDLRSAGESEPLVESLVPFWMVYGDGVERLACESLVERQRWIGRIWYDADFFYSVQTLMFLFHVSGRPSTARRHLLYPETHRSHPPTDLVRQLGRSAQSCPWIRVPVHPQLAAVLQLVVGAPFSFQLLQTFPKWMIYTRQTLITIVQAVHHQARSQARRVGNMSLFQTFLRRRRAPRSGRLNVRPSLCPAIMTELSTIRLSTGRTMSTQAILALSPDAVRVLD